jgi:cyclopropane-fatty-acyl-phospholipid synthase
LKPESAAISAILALMSDFIRSIKSIRKLGFDDRLEKIFRYYFSYCKAGFNSEKIDVVQKIIKID